MKKTNFLSKMLTIFFLLVLASCSNDEKESGPVPLIIAARGGTHIDAMKAVLEEYEQSHTVHVEILALESADLKQKISLDAGNTQGNYDLIMADDPWMPEFCDARIFASLSELGVERDPDIIEAGLNLGTYPYGKGDLYALPVVGNVQLLFYNRGLYNSLGLSVPTSWEEILQNAKMIKEKKGLPGYAIRGQQGNPIVSDFLPILWSLGGSVLNDQWDSSINSEKGLTALKFYMALLDTGINLEKNDLVQAVSTGEAGMSLGWPSWYISGETASAAFASIPGRFQRDDDSHTTGMIGNWMMGITANSQHKEEALSFLKFITSSETQKEMASMGGVPTRRSVYNDADLKTKYPHYPVQLAALENSVPRPRTPEWSKIETALGAELSAAIVGVKTPEEALADAERAINKIMTK